MKTQTEKEKVDWLIDNFAKDPEIIEVVNTIEKGFKTTKNHYGKYMQFLGNFSHEPFHMQIMGKSLILAGANANGVRSALMVLKG
jgi:hypothetical protein